MPENDNGNLGLAVDTVASAELAVSCRGIIQSYGSGAAKVAALRGIDLDVRRGELLMIVGPSGRGKTTLISVITTILCHDAGQCHVLGHDLQQIEEPERAYFRRKAIGFVFQLFNLLPALTAVENVAIPLLIEGVPWKTATSRANELLATIGLGERATALPGTTALAMATRCCSPPLSFAEPTSNLDHETGHAVMQVLRSLTEKSDRTVIVVTHDPRIFEFADRIARMDDGRITEIH